jgi:hypothetical protein
LPAEVAQALVAIWQQVIHQAQLRQQATEVVSGDQAVEARLADLEMLLTQRQMQVEDLSSVKAGCTSAVRRNCTARRCCRS